MSLFDIAERTDLHDRFDFALLWGVAMSTHDPAAAFENAARTVRPGGGLYVMVYAPTYHNSPDVLRHRLTYHRQLATADERLQYVYAIAEDSANAINYMDMLNPFYNWVIEEGTVHEWFRREGFGSVATLNASEPEPVAYHVYGVKREFARPTFDDQGTRVPDPVALDPGSLEPIADPFEPEVGFAWQVKLTRLAGRADDLETPHRSRLIVLEDDEPLWLRHAAHDEIRARGRGAYSHWKDRLILSTSDNSNPNTNQRTYRIGFAK